MIKEMDVSQEQLEADIFLLRPTGKLDAKNSPNLRSVFQQLIDSPESKKIILDLQGVHFVDSSGLAALVSGLRLARENGCSLVLSGAQPQAQIVFRLTMLDRVFPIYASYQEAQQDLM
ncbi:MAG: STAS domain-containing protein [Anaerolineae bacterium]|nr:STAS domain-containing protein [Anaerolineae bacterium]